MKKNDRILIYDDYCPLCSWYSGLFVKYGFLSPDARQAFSTLDPTMISKIDFEKGRNEIPLLDKHTGNVLYGIDALLEILDKKIPFIKSIGSLRPIKWFLKRLYKLISYNRKVIVGKKCSAGSIDCSPDINYFYRMLFMAISLSFNTLMLFPLHNLVLSRLSYYHISFFQLQFAHFVFVFINCSLALTFTKARAIEYMGQINMLALSVILITSLLIILQLFFFNELFITFFLIATTAFVFKEYMRRMEYAGILKRNKWVVSLNMLSLTGFLFFLFH